jgi:hypothetical protein
VNLTCDTWTSPNFQSVLGVTAHWIDAEWKPRDLTVAAIRMRGEHSGENIAKHLSQVLHEVALTERIFGITADNAFSNVTMATFIAPRLEGFQPRQHLLGCMAHVINFGAKAGIKALGHVSVDVNFVDSNCMNENSIIPPCEFNAANVGPTGDCIRSHSCNHKSFGHSVQRRDRFLQIVNYE